MRKKRGERYRSSESEYMVMFCGLCSLYEKRPRCSQMRHKVTVTSSEVINTQAERAKKAEKRGEGCKREKDPERESGGEGSSSPSGILAGVGLCEREHSVNSSAPAILLVKPTGANSTAV